MNLFPRVHRLVGLLAAAGVALSPLGCGGGGNESGADGDATIGCTTDTRAMAYSPGMHLVGSGGAMTFVLDKSDPGPPLKGTNSWTLQIQDSAGAAVTDATLTAVPFMPDHGHGTSVVPVITPQDDGYLIDPLYLFMPGLWQVTIQATTPSAQDQVVFYFCIAG